MAFSDKVVVITGGAQGIGMACSIAFAQEGAKVVIADIDEEAGEELLRSIKASQGQAIYAPTDVANEADIKRLMDTAIDTFQGIDILINNAGVGAKGTICQRPKADWDRVIAVNLTGPYLCSRYAIPSMRERGGGSIINIASTRALMSEADTEPYSASKGGLVALTHSLAISLAKDRIRVNAISPGWIETAFHQKASQRRVSTHSVEDVEQHPVGRIGKPEDIASACLFLADDAKSGFITGTNLVIDGGMTVKMVYV